MPSTHARDAVVSSRLAKVLEAVGRDDAVADLLCDVCGLEHPILGLEKASAPDHVLHVVAADRVADLEKMRARLGTKQYITILNQVCLDHMGRGPIVEHVISIFGKLCTEEGAVAIQMEANVPYTLKWALQTHSAAKRLCEKCVLNASRPRPRATTTRARATSASKSHRSLWQASKRTNGDADFVVAVLKCFGAFSLHDPSIFTMVLHGVTEKVVSATERHGDHAQLLRTAVELFGNLGGRGRRSGRAVHGPLVGGGAVDAIGSILDSCRARIDGDALALIGACFDAKLYNLANDTNAASAVVEGGL